MKIVLNGLFGLCFCLLSQSVIADDVATVISNSGLHYTFQKSQTEPNAKQYVLTSLSEPQEEVLFKTDVSSALHVIFTDDLKKNRNIFSSQVEEDYVDESSLSLNRNDDRDELTLNFKVSAGKESNAGFGFSYENSVIVPLQSVENQPRPEGRGFPLLHNFRPTAEGAKRLKGALLEIYKIKLGHFLGLGQSQGITEESAVGEGTLSSSEDFTNLSVVLKGDQVLLQIPAFLIEIHFQAKPGQELRVARGVVYEGANLSDDSTPLDPVQGRLQSFLLKARYQELRVLFQKGVAELHDLAAQKNPDVQSEMGKKILNFIERVESLDFSLNEMRQGIEGLQLIYPSAIKDIVKRLNGLESDLNILRSTIGTASTSKV